MMRSQVFRYTASLRLARNNVADRKRWLLRGRCQVLFTDMRNHTYQKRLIQQSQQQSRVTHIL